MMATGKMFYKLEQQSAEEALGEISKLTNNYSSEYGLNEKYVEELKKRVNERGYTKKGYLYAPKDVDVIKQVIGRGGCYFYKTTEECGIDFIWHNRKTGKFEFWGPQYELVKAMNIIKSRMDKVSMSHNVINNIDVVYTGGGSSSNTGEDVEVELTWK